MSRKKRKPSYYATGRRRVHRAGPAAESLVTECVRNGSLDVRCETGEVFTSFRRRIRRRLYIDRDGYAGFTLNVERQPGGRPTFVGNHHGKPVKRWRRRQYVLVHRLVVAKLRAIEKYGDKWQANFVELPLCLDVDHEDLNRANNRGRNLRIRTIDANRGRREYTPEEAAQAEADAAEFFRGENA